MNSLFRIFLAMGLLSLAISTARADADNGPPVRKVTVTGTCIMKVVPDEMLWSVPISINDRTLAQAKARHDASLEEALKYLKGIGDGVKDLQTGGISFQKNSGDDLETRRHPYNCSTEVTFTLTDFEKYGPICDALAKFDGTQVQSVDYATSKEAETHREALKRALLDAHDKASALALAAGLSIDKPLSIVEQEAADASYEAQSGGGLEDRGPSGYSGTPAAVAGQIEITATVIVSYDLH